MANGALILRRNGKGAISHTGKLILDDGSYSHCCCGCHCPDGSGCPDGAGPCKLTVTLGTATLPMTCSPKLNCPAGTTYAGYAWLNDQVSGVSYCYSPAAHGAGVHSDGACGTPSTSFTLVNAIEGAGGCPFTGYSPATINATLTVNISRSGDNWIAIVTASQWFGTDYLFIGYASSPNDCLSTVTIHNVGTGTGCLTNSDPVLAASVGTGSIGQGCGSIDTVTITPSLSSVC